MAKILTFWEIDKDGNTLVADQNYLTLLAEGATKNSGQQYEALTDEDITALYGERAVKRTIKLKPNSYRLRLDMQRLAAHKDDKTGLKTDESLLPAARVAATVESWDLVTTSGASAEISIDGFLDLPGAIGDYVDGHVLAYLNPDIIRDPDFLAMFSSKCKPSENLNLA